MGVREVFETEIPGRMQAEPEKAKGINTVYQFVVTGDEAGDWYVDLITDPPAICEGKHDSPKCTVTVDSADFLKIVGGELNPQMAFMSGKLKIDGDMAAAIKLSEVL